MTLENVSLTQIGVVRNQAFSRQQMTTLGLPSAIELFPEYSGGLLWLEKATRHR